MGEDSLTRVETESRHALGFRDLLIYGSGLACSPSDFLPRVVLPFNIGFGHSNTLLASQTFTKDAHSRRDLHRCSIQISTAVNKPSLANNTKACVHCNALHSGGSVHVYITLCILHCTAESVSVSELRRNVSASSGLPSRFWRERGKRGISDLYRR